jgi:hypothetical protein
MKIYMLILSLMIVTHFVHNKVQTTKHTIFITASADGGPQSQSAHATPSAQATIDTRRNLLAQPARANLLIFLFLSFQNIKYIIYESNTCLPNIHL